MNVSTNASVSINGENINATASVNADHATQLIADSSISSTGASPQIALIAYEKAIGAYQFHVNRYKDWMNLYAIFTGAMFVGLYTILNLKSQSKSEIGCISYIITLIGLIASICWWMSQTGYYNWLLSWNEILHQREKDLFKTSTFVYSQIGDTYKPLAKKGRIPKFISTQKVTSFFIQVIVLGWMVIITYLICKSFENNNITILSGLVLFGVYLFLRAIIYQKTWFSSKVDDMLESKK